jgi:hypothetical protein
MSISSRAPVWAPIAKNRSWPANHLSSRPPVWAPILAGLLNFCGRPRYGGGSEIAPRGRRRHSARCPSSPARPHTRSSTARRPVHLPALARPSHLPHVVGRSRECRISSAVAAPAVHRRRRARTGEAALRAARCIFQQHVKLHPFVHLPARVEVVQCIHFAVMWISESLAI